MKTHINRFGEIVTNWSSHKHPDNADFMQQVFWTVWEKPDGRISIAYNLGGMSKSHFIYNITKSEAIEKFTDK